MVEKVPLLALAAVSCGITLSTHTTTQPDAYFERLSLATRLANALVSYAAYLGQSLYPVRLAFFYPHLGDRLPMASIAGSLVLLVAITAVAIFFWRRRPYLLVGWLWFLGTLVPVIGLVGAFPYARADRYTYLSQIGLSIALAWGVCSVSRSRQAIDAARWRGRLLAVVSVAAVIALAAVAWRQASYWRNAETLWTHTIACTEQNQMAHYNLAQLFIREGRTEEAVVHLREVVATDSLYRQLIAYAHDLLAEQLTKEGKTDEALRAFGTSSATLPNGRGVSCSPGDRA